MESAITVCYDLIKCAARPMIRRIKYLKELKRNLVTLTQKKNDLLARESDIRRQLQRAEERRKRPLEGGERWLQKVEEAKTEVSNIERSLQEMETHNCFSKFHSRIKLAKLVFEKISELDKLLTEEFPEGLVDEGSPVETAILFEPPPLHSQSTAEQTMGEIMELLLNNPEIGKIGVYGMGGVGKTTIMKNINNKLAEMMKNHQHFNRIIWVTVSKEVGGIREIQQKIALEVSKELSDKLSRWDEEGRRAAALLRELKGIGKFLIILDDLWKEITLQAVGIPQPNEENNCKVLVTTRDLKVCNSIETQKNVRVKCLSPQEAWDLFVSKVGDLAHNNSEIERLARQVVRQCAGLPLAITTIGSHMRGRTHITAWKYALYKLGQRRGMEDKVYKCLRFTYDHLKSQELQKCFLYCAFFPEDFQISPDKLIEYWVAEGFIKEEAGIDDQHDTWDAEARIKGFYMLQELEDACMLEMIKKPHDDEQEVVRMHNLVRDLAIQIMRKDHWFLAKVESQSRELPKEAWTRANKISFISTSMVNFPKQLNCPSLSTLLLQRNSSRLFSGRVVFPPCLFSLMPVLCVLDLSYCSCQELPASFPNLVSLKFLNLSHSSILKLPQRVGALLNLRYLNLSYTKIQLRQEVGVLVGLRFLDLFSNFWYNIHVNVLSQLTLLENLHLPRYSSNCPHAATIIQEMTYLQCLRSLSMSIEDYGDYLKVIEYVPWDSVKSFFIEVGMDCHVFRTDDSESVVSLGKLNMCDKLSTFCLPNNTKNLYLRNCKIPPLSKFRCLENVRSLKKLVLSGNVVLGNFIVGGEEMEQNALASLNDLELYDMDELKAFGEGKLPIGCLANLKSLWVANCNSFKSLFSSEILQHLNNIEAITVTHCDEIEEIVSHGDGDNSANVGGVTTTNNIIILPKLKRLCFHHLTKLKSISRETAWVCDSLVVLEVFKCPKIDDRLPFKSLPSIKRITAEREWWEGLQWDDAETKALLQCYFIDKGS